LLALFLAFSALGAQAQQDAAAEASLDVSNRQVFVFRTPLFGLTPKQRAARAAERIGAIAPERLHSPVMIGGVDQDGARSYAVALEGTTLFAVFPGDLEPGDPPLEKVATEAASRLQGALQVRWEQGSGRRLALSILWTALATVGLAAVLIALGRGARAVHARTLGMRARAASRPCSTGAGWRSWR
jgi:hypothetical protein